MSSSLPQILARSRNGKIHSLFNQSFNQLLNVGGGGIFVGGQAALAGQTLSAGAGSVRIVANLIEGNQAGAGDGGGIRASRVSGQDVDRSRNQPNNWARCGANSTPFLGPNPPQASDLTACSKLFFLLLL